MLKNNYYRVPVILVLFFLPFSIYAQKTKRIRLIQANEIRYDKHFKKDIQRLIGDVIMEHDSIFMYCDSAYLNDEENNVEAFGHVHINTGDSLDLFGNYLFYNGITKLAEIHDNVRLVDNTTTVNTEHLFYDRLTKISYYLYGGKINSKDNQLYSDKGYYYTSKKEFYFKKNVVLINPEYTMKSDTLLYNTESEIAYFYGPTTIHSEDNYIYCENGWYNTRLDISRYSKNTFFNAGDQNLSCDSLFYDQHNGFGIAYNNITITDTIKNIIVKGNYSEYHKVKGYFMITDSALAILVDNNDSLFLHADTIQATFDSEQSLESLYAYYHTKFFRNDIQGMCDSLFFNFTDSILTMFHEPVLWTKENQLTADTIKIYFENQQVEQMTMHNSSFIISKDDSVNFNQIKGVNMIAYFVKNQLHKIMIDANSETIYAVREEDGSMIGINKAVSGHMWILLADSKIKRLINIDHPTETLFPEKDITKDDRRLKGFYWHEDKRPINKIDIFRW